MTVKSSKFGKIIIGSSDVAEVVSWKFGKKGNNKEYASSSTGGHMKTVPGNKSGMLTLNVLYDPDDPIEDRLKVGDLITFLAHFDNNRKYTVPARVESVDDEVNIQEGGPPTVAVEAQAHGPWTYPDGTVSS